MKTVNMTLIVAFGLLASTSFASTLVKSKKGDLDVTKERGGSTVLCTMGFNDELVLVREVGMDALVKGDCQGWVEKSRIEIVGKPAGDKSLTFGNYDVKGWIDDPRAIFVLEDGEMDFDGVKIDRDFKEYLVYTIDREQTEMKHGEN